MPVTKLLIGRTRPDVALPVVDLPSNASFPSGHAMTSLVTWGVLVLVALPAVRRRWRGWLVTAAAVLVVAVGVSRLALGVHFVSDVLAGWALGAGWLAATTAAFRGWQHDLGRRTPPLSEGLEEQERPSLHLAPSSQPVLPNGRATVGRLVLAWAAVFAVLSAVGLLITGPLLDTGLGRFDRRAVGAFLELRSDGLTDLAQVVGSLSGTRMVVAVALAQAVLALAITASWRPVAFVALVVLGEVSLYFVTAQVVERARPDAVDLTAGLPLAASFPSGHAAAAVALYGALAALVIVYGHHRWRWAVLVLPVLLPPLIGLTRVYVSAHYPTDVAAGLLLGTAWVLACTRLMLFDRGAPDGATSSKPSDQTFVRTTSGV